MPKKKQGNSAKLQFNAYKTTLRWKTNRERKLLNTLEAQPNNESAKKAINNIKYRRRKPGGKIKTLAERNEARNAALTKRLSDILTKTKGPKVASALYAAKVSFKLGDRITNEAREIMAIARANGVR